VKNNNNSCLAKSTRIWTRIVEAEKANAVKNMISTKSIIITIFFSILALVLVTVMRSHDQRRTPVNILGAGSFFPIYQVYFCQKPHIKAFIWRRHQHRITELKTKILLVFKFLRPNNVVPPQARQAGLE